MILFIRRARVVKRQLKKALSIVVASSLALSMPVTAMAEESVSHSSTTVGPESSAWNGETETKSGGIHATDGQIVTKTSDVLSKNMDGVYATNKSKVTVEGNVTTSGSGSGIYNQDAEVKVTGNVTSGEDASYTKAGGNTEIGGNVTSTNGCGVAIEQGGSATVHGSVTANNTGVSVLTNNKGNDRQDSSVRVDKGITVEGGSIVHAGTGDHKTTTLFVDGAEIWKDNKDGKVDLQVNGDIHTTAKTDNEGTKIDRAYSDGISITNLSGEVSTRINGSIKADSFVGSTNDATGISISEDNHDEDNPVDKTQKTDVAVNGDITAKSDYMATGIDFDGLHGTTNVAVDGNISADAKGGSASGILLRSEDENATADIIVNGDVTGSTYGTYFDGFDGNANVIINGALSGGESAVIITKETNTTEDEDGKEVTEKHGYNGNSNITIWKMTSDKDELVKVVEETRSDITGKVKSKQDSEATNNVLKNINYIIRTDKVSNGTIHLYNTRLISGFDTARETEDITIKVEASDGYKVDSVKNGDAVLKKNSDGTYTLTVPRGGGVQLSAVLSVIQKSHSSSGSSGGSSGSHPGVTSTNTQTISSSSGATVSTTVSDSNGTHNTNAVVKIANKQATVNTSEQTGNGNSIIIRNVSGDVAGATFAGVGTVSADGKSITTIDGQVYAVTYAPMLIIKTGDQTVGCFVDLTTGAPLATGKTEVYYQLAADGQMYAHWVNPMGFFYTGTVVMNGKTITFNEQGVMIDVR